MVTIKFLVEHPCILISNLYGYSTNYSRNIGSTNSKIVVANQEKNIYGPRS